ncbi:Uncharacterised protein g6989 [Pycnogonum litorale]
MTLVRRKRNISCTEDDGCEFMPISKRIKNIHIRSNNNVPSVDNQHEHSTSRCSSPNLCNSTPCSPPNSQSSLDDRNRNFYGSFQHMTNNPVDLCISDLGCNGNVRYKPLLNASDNPHYYHSNKVLFEAFMERNRRSYSKVVL